jgi:hypothetical protein
MPKDDWLRARNKDLAKGRSVQDEREHEDAQLASLDEWISKRESVVETKGPKLRARMRKCCNSPRGKGPHVGNCCNFR